LNAGHSGILYSIVLWVPDLRLAVCDVLIYGKVHKILLDWSTPGKHRAAQPSGCRS
ncbi:hypothetical protein ASPBRDRAFT_139292, partial [Aspergillus brasiliensis CBS 101740]